MANTLSSERALSDQNPVNPVNYLQEMGADIEIEIDGHRYDEDVLPEIEFEEVNPDEIEIADDGDGYEVDTRYNHLGRETGYDRVHPGTPGVGTATVRGLLEPSTEEKAKQPVPADD